MMKVERCRCDEIIKGMKNEVTLRLFKQVMYWRTRSQGTIYLIVHVTNKTSNMGCLGRNYYCLVEKFENGTLSRNTPFRSKIGMFQSEYPIYVENSEIDCLGQKNLKMGYLGQKFLFQIGQFEKGGFLMKISH